MMRLEPNQPPGLLRQILGGLGSILIAFARMFGRSLALALAVFIVPFVAAGGVALYLGAGVEVALIAGVVAGIAALGLFFIAYNGGLD